jgi:hypothetical protein
MPDYVNQYLDAKWWIFIHWGLPVLCVYLLVYGIVAWQQYQEDCHVNDEGEELSKTAGKTLGL